MNEEGLFYVAAGGFEAARDLDGLHGHSFKARVWAAPQRCAGDGASLAAGLNAALAPLQYGSLNDHLNVPNDAHLAQWLAARLAVDALTLRSAPDRGARLDARGALSVWRRFRIEAAHQLPNVRPGHKCGRMHGHGFEVVLHAHASAADASALCERLGAHWAPLQQCLHLACLNDVPGLENPTSEVLAAWLWARLREAVPTLSAVEVLETATAGCRYDGAHYRIWKDTHFESAVRLLRAPEGDARRRVHGHSYRLRLHLTAPLDAVMGWTVDYGDVKERFAPVYARLDHHALDTLGGVGDADLAGLLHWVRGQTQAELPALDAIELHETPTCGALLAWDGAADSLLS